MGGKQEDRFDLDSPGDVQGFISLDEARVLALQYARENREFYGRYAEQELSWDVISAAETGGSYEVRLSYSCAGDFRTAGIEQFNIDKSGLIESRKIVRQPHLTTGFIAASIAIVVVVVTGAIFGGLSATGTRESTNASVISPTPLATTVSITPETLARLVSPNGDVTIELDAETVDVPTQLAYVPLSVGEIPALPAKVTATGKVFELTTETPLLKPITIIVEISAAEAVLAAGNANNVVIQHHIEGAWTPLATAVDFEASTATAQVDSLSLFALTVLEPVPTPTPAPAPAQIALPTATLAPAVKPTLNSPVGAVPTAVATPSPTAVPPTVVPALAPDPTPVPVPTAQPIPLPTATPVPVKEWLLENVMVAGDKVTVFVRILGSAWVNTTLDGVASEETIIDGSIRADVFRNVPPGNHTVRVFTMGVPGQEDFRSLKVMPPTPTLIPTQTPSGPPTPTPIPTYRIFVNGIPIPAQNRLIKTDAGSVTLSHAPKSDGGYKTGTEVTLVAGSSPGFIVTWGGVDTQRFRHGGNGG